MSVGILLGYAKVHVEEQDLPGRSGFRRLAIEQASKPVDVDELVVVGQAIEGEGFIRRPLAPAALMDPNTFMAIVDQPCGKGGHIPRAVAVDHDVAVWSDAFCLQQSLDFFLVDALQPGAGECHGAGDVAAPGLTSEPPAVVRGHRPNVDDAQVRIAEPIAELGGRDWGGDLTLETVHAGHRCVPLRQSGHVGKKKPLPSRGPAVSARRSCISRAQVHRLPCSARRQHIQLRATFAMTVMRAAS